MLSEIKISHLSQDGRTDKTMAMVSCVIDSTFKIDKIRVVNGSKGLFVAMPQMKNKAGEYKDVCYPVTAEVRKTINDAILAKYNETAVKA